VCVCEKGRRASPDGERVLAAQSRFSAEPSGSVMEGKNWGTAETLHLDWEIFHFVSQMQRCSERERWCDVTQPSLDLILHVDNVFFDEDRHLVYKLLSRYLGAVYGVAFFEHDAERDIVLLKWLFVLDQLASESLPVKFPVASKLLYGDCQWLPNRPQRECLLPPWELLPRDFLFDHEVPLQLSDVESRMKEIDSFLESFVKDEIEDERFDFLPVLLGWILCPDTKGWTDDYEWGAPHPDSGEARTARLWQVLVHLQKILYRDRSAFPGRAAADALEIVRWACRLHDLVTCSYSPDLDRGQDGWLDFLGVSNPV
jgi:hypothetical protein